MTVLFVDDEKIVLDTLARSLRKESYKRIFIDSAASAMALFEKEDIHVIVTDVLMPGMDGLTLLKKVREAYPETIRIVLSGQTQLTQIVESINKGEIFRYIIKPLVGDDNELARVIREGIDYYLLRRDRTELIQRLKQKNQDLVNSLAQIELLEGILPICALCKRIKNDNNCWIDVENYIQEHSSALFSHGYCPECYEEHFAAELDHLNK